MKNHQLQLLLLVLFLVPLTTPAEKENVNFKTTYKYSGQKLALISGDISMLKDEKSFNVILDKENFTIGLKATPEDEYNKLKVTELNEKHPGTMKGDNWLQSWETMKSRSLPSFIEGFNSAVSEINMTADSNFSQANSTILIKHTWVQIINGNAFLYVFIDIVPTKDHGRITASLMLTVTHITNQRDKSKKYPGTYLSGFYATGETLAKYFEKILFD